MYFFNSVKACSFEHNSLHMNCVADISFTYGSSSYYPLMPLLLFHQETTWLSIHHQYVHRKDRVLVYSTTHPKLSCSRPDHLSKVSWNRGENPPTRHPQCAYSSYWWACLFPRPRFEQSCPNKRWREAIRLPKNSTPAPNQHVRRAW